MSQRNNLKVVFYACGVICAALTGGELRANDSPTTEQQLRLLQEQNHALQQQLQRQQELIESLSRKVNEIQDASVQRGRELERLQSEVKDVTPVSNVSKPVSFGQLNISGEGGVAFFNSGSHGQFPNAEFRVDEAKLFVEAPIWKEVYFFSELNLATRESSDLEVLLGELYLDFENVSRLWNQDRMLNLRIGRMDIPFGEEYLTRDAIDNPLISHSLSDLWGVDAGIELYGKLGKFHYVVAVQNGGPSGGRDFDSDKSVAGRVTFDPSRWLHLSVSGMRTGELRLPDDYWSALWFGCGWFLPFGSTNVTKFHADLVEGDVQIRLPHGQLKAFGGYVRYDDNATDADNRRDIYYYSLEAVHDLSHNFYAGARFSQIFADKGYPITGQGNMGEYLFSGALTDEIWRLSLGVGYRWSQNLIAKAEYSFEQGRLVGGGKRNHEDLFAVQVAFKF